ncbi:PREDICTED: uncharacterized protein LOC104752037 [Camelina sativa]|uniref:Uncharacterized protein LOC104752037 n=1 Tax=Camelina sativa TaxID=90675 RepID=A0ABM0WKJ8_CAMSA|nr:PREDICTED: uncharacterized protein LOC104752037 [Camelina sativa]
MVEMMMRRQASKFPVKREIVEDSLEDEHAPLYKRTKLWSNRTGVSKFNLLEEPSPLGLSLRKSPSFLELIQMRLSQSGDDTTSETSRVKKESFGFGVGTVEKLKASNFHATVLRIGQWEYKAMHDGDLVAKCYFAKHKLVWEVLEQGLKSKIEIQWSDIMSLKANLPDDEPGTLSIVLARRPLFFREINPLPRKHTTWLPTSDFTDGHASMNRKHFLQCPPGILDKHFEKLVQCDHRLFCLSRQPEINLASPFFDSRTSIFEDPSMSGSYNMASPVGAQSSSEHVSLSHDALSPSSVMDAHAIEGVGVSVDSRNKNGWSQIKVPGLPQSISMSDLLTLYQGCENNQEFEEMKQLLLSDTLPDTSDEKSVMSKVNSFCNLLQSAANSQLNIETTDTDKEIGVDRNRHMTEGGKRVVDLASSSKPLQGMSRKDSFSDLSGHLPRIASLTKFLSNISEED